MEHEIIGHSKKVIKALKHPEKNFGEKFKEILTEVLIIIFAVTLAAFIERTREHYKERGEAKEFLAGLKSDVRSDVNLVTQFRKELNDMRKSYNQYIKYTARDVDSMERNKIQESFYLPKLNMHPLNGRYDGFKSSGRIQSIENDSLRNHILKLYEEDFPYIAFAETQFNNNQTRIEDLIFANADDKGDKPISVPRLLVSAKGKMILTFGLGYSDAVLRGYDKMIKQAEVIEKEIDKE